MNQPKTVRKPRRHRSRPIGLSLDELGLLAHINSHLVDGKFEHRNFDTGVIFGVNKSKISRLLNRLESKGAIAIERDPETGEHPYDPVTGKRKIAVVILNSPVAQVHLVMNDAYQNLNNLESPSVTVANKPRCTGAHNREYIVEHSFIEGSALTGAQVQLALAAARARLQKQKELRTGNFDHKQVSYRAKEVREALAEVRRLEDLLVETEAKSTAGAL
jgi:hypothetical protein